MWRYLSIPRAIVVDLSPLGLTVTAASLMVKSLISGVTDTTIGHEARCLVDLFFIFFSYCIQDPVMLIATDARSVDRQQLIVEHGFRDQLFVTGRLFPEHRSLSEVLLPVLFQ